jgi:hypothetical protein
MEFKGTKGKWYIENFNEPKKGKYPADEIDISTETAENMCTVWHCEALSDEIKANALLISKAPEMLEMLKSIVSDFEGDYVVDEVIVDQPYKWLIDRYKEAKQLIKETTEI